MVRNRNERRSGLPVQRHRRLLRGIGWEALEDRTLLSLADPGFELPSVGVGTWAAFQTQPAGSPWTFLSTAGVAGNGSGVTAGNPSAPDGTQVAYLQMTGDIRQSVTLDAGSYSIGFKAAQRGNYQFSSQTIQVFVDGNSLGVVQPSGTSYQDFATPAFSVAAGSHVVRFLGLNPNGGDNTVLLDSVRISTVIPPSGNDFGFESPSVGAGSWSAFQLRPVGSPWTFLSSAGLAGNGSGVTAGNPNAPDGTQVAFLQMTGEFSQSITLAAGSYSIGFLAAQRAY
jgi:hypothetical protein